MSRFDQKPVVLFFDIDGTLIDSRGAGGRALLAALQQEFHVPEPKPVALHGRTDLGITRQLLTGHGIEPTESAIERLCLGYFDLLPAELEHCDGHVLPGVERLLETLADTEHCVLTLLTGNMPASAQLKLEHFGLWRFFVDGIFGHEAAHRPDLAQPALEMAAKLVGTGRSSTEFETVVIGDTPLDVQLAQAMQVRCLAVCTGGFSDSQLRTAGATRVIETLDDTAEISGWCLNS